MVLADIMTCGVFAMLLDKALIIPRVNQAELESVREQALDTACKIEEEGIVLLKNNGALPMSGEHRKINLLGYRSYFPIYGGSGSGGSTYLDNRVDLAEALTNSGFEINL